MTAVEASTPGAGPADVLAPVQRRGPRGPVRGAARFPAQLAEASAGEPGGPAGARGQRPQAVGRKAKDGPEDGAGPLTGPIGPFLVGATPDQPQADGLSGLGAMQSAAGAEPPAGQAGHGLAWPTPSAPAAAREGADRSPGEGSGDPATTRVPAPSEGAATGTASSGLAGPAAQATAEGPAQHPAQASAPGDGTPDAARPEAGPAQGTTAPRGDSAARRETSTLSASLPTGFRLEPSGHSDGKAAVGRAGPAEQPAAGQSLPADVLVERGGPGSGALHVTIAAATADLRDRFRAATDELRAELSAIGAEVDAINVEVRADLADGAGGAGGETADGEAAWGETGRGEPDAAVRLDLADPGAGQAPNDEIPVDEAGGPIGDAGSADTPDGTAGGGGGRTARGASQEIDQLRLRLDPGGAARRRAGEEAFGPAPAGRPNRIDRYA